MPPLAHASSRFPCLSTAARVASPAQRGRVLAIRLAVLCVAGACARDRIADGVTDSAFVATMAELERVERTPGLDSSARVAARAAALQRRGLTPAQLEAAAAALADEPERALALYRAIDQKASGDSMPGSVPEPPSTGVRRRR